MRLGGEDRAQSVQVGVIVLFGFLIVALSMYQATIVPQQNAEVEFRHSQTVQDDLVGLGNSIDATGRVGDAAPAAVKLGTRYPSRTFFVNPAPAAGTLRTEPAGNVTISGVEVLSTTGNEANDYWGADRNFSTRSVVYEPRYNQYDEAPVTRYEAGGVVNDFGGRTLAVDELTVVDGNRITLVAVDGTLSHNGVQLLSVDPAAVSSVDRRETVTGDIRLVVPSTVSADVWADDLLSEEIAAGWVNGTTQVGSDRVRIDLNASRNYSLGVAGVGVGRNVTATSAPAYIDVERAPAAADAGSVREVVVEVRDRYGNPVGNQQVTGAVTGGSGSLVSGTVTTDDRGRAVFEYEAAGSGTATIRFSYDDLGSFDSSAPEDAEHSLTVSNGDGTGSGSATYELVWDTDRIDDTNGVTYVAANDTIVVDPSVASSPIPVTSRATNDDGDPIDGATVDYSTADSSVAGFSGSNSTGETGSDGRSTVDMEFGNGETTVYAATPGGGSDALTVIVTTDSGDETGDLTWSVTDDTDTNTGQAIYRVSYQVEHASSFSYVEATFRNLNDSMLDRTVTSNTTGGTLTYDPGSNQGGGDTYNITLRAYDTGGNVVDVRTTTDVADNTDPSGSGPIGGADDPQLARLRIDDTGLSGHPGYYVSYNVTNSGDLGEVEVEFRNLDQSWATRTTTSTQPRGALSYDEGYVSGSTYQVIVRVFDSNDVLVDRERVNDTVDGVDPSGNDDMSKGSSPTFSTLDIADDTNVGADQGAYAVSYGVVDSTGTFDRVVAQFKDLTSGWWATRTTTGTGTGGTLTYEVGGTANDQFRIEIRLVDDDGVVVSETFVEDTADGTDP
ncbi:Ig-like domain-containing protein [Halorarum halophilum]|uniref:Ig-like domain-containing protein n=1 Tax=Halorarum halophilum TaxID=2743090 RepID=A0A7D5KC07_9EURY|nr:Ig-like domain-containing protein [Halobaculum halophilum]QLG26357.1 Ig-like domain-containing protein [Halobaculum halophilum]